MQEIPLAEYVALPGNSQQKLADSLGCYQSAISNMIRAERNILVLVGDDGTVQLKEEKIIATQKPTPETI